MSEFQLCSNRVELETNYKPVLTYTEMIGYQVGSIPIKKEVENLILKVTS